MIRTCYDILVGKSLIRRPVCGYIRLHQKREKITVGLFFVVRHSGSPFVDKLICDAVKSPLCDLYFCPTRFRLKDKDVSEDRSSVGLHVRESAILEIGL